MSMNLRRRRAPVVKRGARHIALLAAIGLLAAAAGPLTSAAWAAPAAAAAGATASATRASAKAAGTGGQAGAPAASRAPSAAEADSFNAFQRALHPDTPPSLPQWRISRAKGQGRWQVVAELDSTPQPARAGLCRLQRSSFHYDERARKDQRWSAGDSDAGANSAASSTGTTAAVTATAATYVWLAHGAVCIKPQPGQAGQPALLLPGLSDAAALALLRGQAELLSRARLLFAGNTSCARLRALDFTLQALGPGEAAGGAGVMYQLRYRSDRDSEAWVSVRQHRAELTAWNVSCPAP
ncbi:hypothetical protein ACFOLJ_19640 [Rugamonas sp. CCM 8940]|uniref:hypothetical protein n=1 Tax=Rugamonas sp. CCM 8940 TaxID=2765359 RepID=UPI0018F56C8B|nr:hypothetical protein [Rugamonas sp. CCM 8940]MBJ7312319.1 hypothetical protein [Rugamonas sp. CCM 8940]